MNYIEVYRMIKQAADYIVKSGDTLGGIAAANKVKTNDLATWNNISNPNKIRVGQKLRLSAPVAATTQPTTTTTPAATPQYNQYKIKAGDTFEGIGAPLNISTARIQKANPGIDPKKLRIGQTINIPLLSDVEDVKARTGFDPTTEYADMDTILKNIWTKESSRGKNLRNSASTASGHFHMLDKTFNEMKNNYKKDFGTWTKADLDNYEKAEQMARKKIHDDVMRFQLENERAVTDKDIYAMWTGGYDGRNTQHAIDYANDAADPNLAKRLGFDD
jgi:LysM repeat protein